MWRGRDWTEYGVEEDVDGLVGRWGFETYAMDEWDREDGVTRIIDPDRVGESTLRRYRKKNEKAGR